MKLEAPSSTGTSLALQPLRLRNKAQLGHSFVIPEPFLRELGRPASAMVTFRQWIEAVPKVRLDSGHARYAADGPPPVSMHDHPMTIGRLSATSPMVMLDGYHRVVRFWIVNTKSPSPIRGMRSTIAMACAGNGIA